MIMNEAAASIVTVVTEGGPQAVYHELSSTAGILDTRAITSAPGYSKSFKCSQQGGVYTTDGRMWINVPAIPGIDTLCVIQASVETATGNIYELQTRADYMPLENVVASVLDSSRQRVWTIKEVAQGAPAPTALPNTVDMVFTVHHQQLTTITVLLNVIYIELGPKNNIKNTKIQKEVAEFLPDQFISPEDDWVVLGDRLH